MKSEVIQWNNLLDHNFKLSSDLSILSERFDSFEKNSLELKTIFSVLYYLDLFYQDKINKNVYMSKVANIDGLKIDLIDHFFSSDHKYILELSEDNIIIEIMRCLKNTNTQYNTVKTLFVNQRKRILKSLESIFLLNDNKLSKFSYRILKFLSDQTFMLIRGFFLGRTKEDYQNLVLDKSASFLEKQIGNPFIHLDLVKTFLNSIKQKENPQILDVSQSDISFGLLGWFNGFNMLIIDENDSKLEIISLIAEKYSYFFQNHLIFPPNDNNSLKQLFCLKDKIPELKRLKNTSQNTFEGIQANFPFTNLKKSEIFHLLDRIVGLLRPGGFLLIQDYFQDEKISTLTISLPKIEYVNIKKAEFEEYLRENSLKILLRTSEFHILNKTSYIIMK